MYSIRNRDASTPALAIARAVASPKAFSAVSRESYVSQTMTPSRTRATVAPLGTPDYEARKLNNLPNSLLDYNDAKRGLEPLAERRARERRHNRPSG